MRFHAALSLPLIMSLHPTSKKKCSSKHTRFPPVSSPLPPKARRSRAARRIGMSVLAASMASASAAAPSRSASATPTRFGRPASAQENKMPSRSSASPMRFCFDYAAYGFVP
jgi:hypothetical protein